MELKFFAMLWREAQTQLAVGSIQDTSCLSFHVAFVLLTGGQVISSDGPPTGYTEQE